MANSFDKKMAIDSVAQAINEARTQANHVVANIAKIRTSLANAKATVVANADGYFVNPDDTDKLTAVQVEIRDLINGALP